MKKIWCITLIGCACLNIFNFSIAEAKQKIIIDTNDVIFNDHFKLSGTAKYIDTTDNKFVRFTEWVQWGASGGIYLKNKIDLRDDFTFRGTVGFGEMTNLPGDGMWFVFHPGNISSIGTTGGSLGVTPLKYALGFVIDTFDNDYQWTVGEGIVPYGAFWETKDRFLRPETVIRSDMKKIINSEDKRNFFNGKQKNIEFIYTAANKTLRVNYQDDQGNIMHWEKDLTEYIAEITELNPEKIPLVAFAVTASKEMAYNEHTVYFGNVKYTIYTNALIYEFVKSQNSDPNLPKEVIVLLPSPKYNLENGNTVTPEILTSSGIADIQNNGTWYFAGWDKESVVIRDDDEKIIGTWFFFRAPELTPVFDLTNVTEEEKKKIEDEIRKSNPNTPIKTIEIQSDGSAKITFNNWSTKDFTPNQTITRTEQKIPFQIIYKDDENLWENEEKVMQEWEEWLLVNNVIIKPKKDKIIHRGVGKISNGGPGGFSPTIPVETILPPTPVPEIPIIPESPKTPGFIFDLDSAPENPPIIPEKTENIIPIKKSEPSKVKSVNIQKEKFILPKTGAEHVIFIILVSLLVSGVIFIARRKNIF